MKCIGTLLVKVCAGAHSMWVLPIKTYSLFYQCKIILIAKLTLQEIRILCNTSTKSLAWPVKVALQNCFQNFPLFLFCFENFIKFLIKPEKTCIRNIPYPSIPFLDFNNLWKSLELPVEVRLQQSNCLNKLLSLKDI